VTADIVSVFSDIWNLGPETPLLLYYFCAAVRLLLDAPSSVLFARSSASLVSSAPAFGRPPVNETPAELCHIFDSDTPYLSFVNLFSPINMIAFCFLLDTPGTTLPDIRRVLSDDRFRNRLLRKSSDNECSQTWSEFNMKDARQQAGKPSERYRS
jgi:hypothetical protein